ncbi:MAG: glycosyltransferase family A protein [Deltaproteobacteria bacterium]
MLFSVVVCTYNRAGLLSSCLDSLAGQSADPETFEVIIVDNNSTDKTPEVAKAYLERKNFRCIREEKQGLSHARNAGFTVAGGEYAAYIDDDARADKDWVREMTEFTKRRPDAVAFGGPYRHFSLAKLPEWCRESYFSWGLGDTERPLQASEWLNGTNMAYRRTILSGLNGFDAGLGMRRYSISYGEETRLLSEIKRLGLPIYYVPQMKVEHFAPEYKQRVWWFVKSSYAGGRDSWRIFRDNGDGFFKVLVQTLNALARLVSGFIKGMLRGLHYKTAFVDSSADFFYLAGRFFNIKKRGF